LKEIRHVERCEVLVLFVALPKCTVSGAKIIELILAWADLLEKIDEVRR